VARSSGGARRGGGGSGSHRPPHPVAAAALRSLTLGGARGPTIADLRSPPQAVDLPRRIWWLPPGTTFPAVEAGSGGSSPMRPRPSPSSRHDDEIYEVGFSAPSLCFGQWRWWCAHDDGGGGVRTALVASTVCARQWWWWLWWWWRACDDGGAGVVRAMQLGWWGPRCWGGGASRWARGAVGILFWIWKNFLCREPCGLTAHVCREHLRWLSAKRPLPAQLCRVRFAESIAYAVSSWAFAESIVHELQVHEIIY
jgi:hypothetical protein